MARKQLTIWKFPLLITDEQLVSMPRGSTPLSVDFQGDTLTMWALVDPVLEAEQLKVHIYGTGNPVPRGRPEVHVGSVQKDGFVWHVFREGWKQHGDDR